MSEIINVPMAQQRDIRTVTAEIRTITEQTRKMLVSSIVEIGRRLCEAKEMLPHGEWGRWLAEEVEFKQSTANNYMRIFREYSAEQMTLDGAVANSQTIGNLSYTKALQLLALPAEEREEFAEKHDVEAMSSRELEEALAEARGLRAENENQRRIIADQTEKLEKRKEKAIELARAKQELQKELQEQIDQLGRNLARAEREAEEAETAMEKAKAEALEAGNALKKTLEEKAAPAEISPEEREKIAAEVVKAMEGDIKKAEDEAFAARQAADAAAEEAARLKKQMEAAQKEMVLFAADFERVQMDFEQLLKRLGSLPTEEQRSKCARAVKTLLQKLGERV